MGSDTDWSVMADAAEALAEFDVAVRGRRGLGAPHAAADARLRPRAPPTAGIEVIIAGAGGAAHLPGMVAVGDAAAGDRRAGAAGAGWTAWTRCCRSCRCRPACRWRRCRSAAPQRRPAGGADPRRRPTRRCAHRIAAFQSSWRSGAGQGCGAAGRLQRADEVKLPASSTGGSDG